MKTIFITAFEGAEAKNILRTPILPTLLAEKNLRVVALMKNKERAEYYKKEFSDPRIFYEVVERPTVRGLDRVFAGLKFMLLRTETTDLRRRMMYDLEKNAARYYKGLALNRIFARPIVRRFLRWCDEQFVHDATYGKLFEKYKPDLVFCAHLFDEPEVHLLREAKKRRVQSIGFINSWDKVTARCIMRLLPDRAVVFNDIVKKELQDHNEMAADDIFVAGLPQYDHYIRETYISREAFYKNLGIDPRAKLIMYAPEGRSFSTSDWEMIDMLYAMRDKGDFGNGVEILVRFQPNDFFEKEEIEKRPYLLYQYPGVRFSSKRGVDWDMNGEDLKILRNTLRHTSLLVCYTSSMVVDAALFDTPIININFEIKKAPMAKSPTQFFRMAHYKNALATGGIRMVGSRDELKRAVCEYLSDPSRDAIGRARLVREQCQFTDGGAGERIGEYILKILNTKF